MIVWHTFCVLLVVRGSSSLVPPTLRAKIVSPIHFKQVKGVTNYETSVPMLFDLSMNLTFHPESTERRDLVCRRNDKHCHLQRDVMNMFWELERDLLYEEGLTPLSTIHSREPRFLEAAAGLAAGFFLRPLISKWTGGLFGYDNEWSKPLNALRDSVHDGFKQFLESQQQQTHFNVEVVETFKKFKEHISELAEDASEKEEQTLANLNSLINLLQAKFESDNYHRGMESCRNHHIPIGLITPKLFVGTLLKYDKMLNQSKHALAIPPSRFSEYFKLPLADCFFTEGVAKIFINIPVVRQDMNWKLFEIIHSKFAYRNQVCELYPKESAYIATSHDKTVLINSHLLHPCNVHDLKMCLIPPYVKESEQSLNCAVGILHGKDVEELSKVCSFRCSDDSSLMIAQVAHDLVVLTNVKVVKVRCVGHPEESYNFEALGNVQVQLSCGCTVFADELRLDEPFPCSSNEYETPIISHAIPFFWSNIKYAISQNSNVFVTNHSGVINHNWTVSIPVINVSRVEVTAPERVKVPDALNYVDIWLIVLTTVLATNFAMIILVMIVKKCRS